SVDSSVPCRKAKRLSVTNRRKYLSRSLRNGVRRARSAGAAETLAILRLTNRPRPSLGDTRYIWLFDHLRPGIASGAPRSSSTSWCIDFLKAAYSTVGRPRKRFETAVFTSPLSSQ